MKGSGAVSRLTAPQRSVVGQLRVYLELAKGGTDPLSWDRPALGRCRAWLAGRRCRGGRRCRAAVGDRDGVLGSGDGLDLDRSGGTRERAGSPGHLAVSYRACLEIE